MDQFTALPQQWLIGSSLVLAGVMLFAYLLGSFSFAGAWAWLTGLFTPAPAKPAADPIASFRCLKSCLKDNPEAQKQLSLLWPYLEPKNGGGA